MSGKTILIALLVLLIVAAGGVGAYYTYKHLSFFPTFGGFAALGVIMGALQAAGILVVMGYYDKPIDQAIPALLALRLLR